jgi:gas vesicle protein
MSDNANELGAFLAGFVIGGLVGAATAIILAPQSGAETRAQISTRSGDLVRAGGEQFQQYRDKAEAYTQEYLGKANELIVDTREQVQQAGGKMQEQARIVLDKGKERVTQARPNSQKDNAGADNDAGE